MKIIFITLSALLLSYYAASQSIRKNYNEMTALERTNLVNAFYSLRTGPDLINDLAVFHGAFFDLDNSANPTAQDIHFNLPDEPERDIFFAWHRQQIFEVEQAMQDINPYNSIPFWNTSTDQSITSPLWAQNFMGQFNADWNLNRNLGGDDMLPMPSEVTQVQSQSNFLIYSDMMERGPVHHGPHRWIGGVMAATVSPRDPVFYLHHTFIDKLWKEWEDLRGTSAFIRTDMIRYNGTYVFNGQTLPLVNPNSITDSRSRGVFYGENQLAVLDNYTVSNTYNSQELFFYQYVIEAGNNFEVPASRNARFESVTRVRLTPGFHAANGSNFRAVIGDGTGSQREYPAIVSNQIPWDNRGIPINWDAYRPQDLKAKIVDDIHIYPNPFSEKLTLISQNSYDTWLIEIFDLSGRKLYEKEFSSTPTVIMDDLGFLKTGPYMMKLTLNENTINSSTIIKQ
jgi:tyrosinase